MVATTVTAMKVGVELGVEEIMEETMVAMMVVMMETPVPSAMEILSRCGAVTTNHALRWLVHSAMHFNLTVASMVVVVIIALTTTTWNMKRQDATTAWEAIRNTKENMI
eukprot:5177507-Ditylum_brightwellii.AAC.1